MWPRLGLKRSGALRLAHLQPQSGCRGLSSTQTAATAHWSRSPRPQLPFLVIPAATPPGTATTPAARKQHRYFATKRQRWLRHEALAFARYTLYFWGVVTCVLLGQFVLQQEWMEQAHPTPPEWSFLSRLRLRGALTERDGSGEADEVADTGSGDEPVDVRIIDHVKIIQILLDLLARLEDARIDGRDVVVSGPPPPADAAAGPAVDASAKSEPWRRGYFEALLAAAAAAEHVEGWVRDRTRNVACPPDMVVGPSNPHPRPLPPGASGAPREEDCETCFPAPGALYRKLLHTRGLTARQRLTAALAYANYLEFKDDVDGADAVYGRAIQTAAAGHELGDADPLFLDPLDASPSSSSSSSTAWIRDWTAHPADTPASQNLLDTLTAYATFRARQGDVAAALPVLVALLQARRALPQALPPALPSISLADGVFSRARAFVAPPPYPPAPDDGFAPPAPSAQTRCDEAALHLHIGEILYATASRRNASSAASWLPFRHHDRAQHARDEGIAWTREAVDMAEEQLRALQSDDTRRQKQQLFPGTGPAAMPPADRRARAAGRQCLATGLDNWAAMVGQLARDEQQQPTASSTTAAATAAASTKGAHSAAGWSYWPAWLTFWGDGGAGGSWRRINGNDAKPGRWTTEQQVIAERRRRAKDVLVGPPQPKGIFSLMVA